VHQASVLQHQSAASSTSATTTQQPDIARSSPIPFPTRFINTKCSSHAV
jgi:hypothetical protein